jgi:hypothetical protein
MSEGTIVKMHVEAAVLKQLLRRRMDSLEQDDLRRSLLSSTQETRRQCMGEP